ncbi:metallophosphoesterase [Epilithonimonas xixisoli]|uniref:Calcineurin-like phosphoesterase family protein n=1 Tax=Epilithonimonas xixisoli TaxID=1476462 RepID=A0A4R8IDZ1_9FLAO|nr:metallophosphoesterase [Epilithonimonas xixisoli]TDX86676.1 calcineurin-like phosphoesterase family protein [Epilithonimonas xixisoli]
MKKIYPLFLSIIISITAISCAVQNADYGKNAKDFEKNSAIKDSIIHTFYLVGDAGNLDQDEAFHNMNTLKDSLAKASANSTLLFLGDNIYPVGMPKKDDKNRPLAEKKMDNQISLSQNFRGKTIFIPGNHDWYNNGIKGLKREEDYVIEKLNGKSAFSPRNGCPIETRKINKKLTLILIDTEWVLADWSKNPGINEKCDLKTREDFYTEFEDQLNKNQNKTIVVATHHPLITHGSHGGFYSWEKQLFPLENKIPLPILATGINLIRATGGITHQDISNQNYKNLADRLKTLIGGRKNVVVVSGHDHNLQYIEQGDIRQIVSGAGSKTESAQAVGNHDFSFGKNGYAELKISKSGNAEVSFFSLNQEKSDLLFRKTVLGKEEKIAKDYQKNFAPNSQASIYDSAMTKKNKFYEFLWGKHYREYYSKKINVKNLALDTLFGGVKTDRAGGGHQTKSLRLETKNGNEYVIRALRKSGVRFLQSVAFKNQYVIDEFTGSYADKFLLDFYTTSHPYTPLVIGEMADKLGIRHTTPQLFYIPKQKTLKNFNENFGDELYYLEDRPMETEENPNKVVGTDEVILNLAKDEKYKIDEKSWIKARLFDMLIGDWDRHHDQWKFEARKENGNVIYSPIPKDRDQAFTKYDGFVTGIIMEFPELKHMQTFDNEIESVKWFNREPYPLDLVFAKNSVQSDWLKEAEFIQNNLNENDIRLAFKSLPKEVQDDVSEDLIKKLLIRKKDLPKYASQYYHLLNQKVILTGTDKKDRFVITRLPNNETEIKIIRLKKSGEELQSSKLYSGKITKEILLYGLDDEDEFLVEGNQKSSIKIKLLGGLDNDKYSVSNSKKVTIYDYKSKANNLDNKGNTTVKLTDDYDINQYNYRNAKYNVFTTFMNFNFNPDDALAVGFNADYTVNDFIKNPYSQKHHFTANYFTGTKGYELAYRGLFPLLKSNWFYGLDTRITSSHYIRNFYGIGNETINPKDEFGDRFNNVRAKEFAFSPSINWNKNASTFSAKLNYEILKIDRTNNRYISIPGVVNPDVFTSKQFGGADVSFNYENFDNTANPKLGMKFDIRSVYNINLKDTNRQYASIETGLGFLHYLTKNQKLVWSSYAKAKWLLGDDYEFYQMATLGGSRDLRGFRFNRFYGKNSFYQTSDLRYEVGKIKNSILPLSYGFFGGFDLGRVWVPNEKSNKWHNSYGGGFWLNAVDAISANLSYFTSSDGGRLVVGIGGTF